MRAERCAISSAYVLPDEVALQLVEIEARAEGPLAAAEHHHPDVVVGLGPLHGLVQLLQQLLADRVALVRPVEPDSRDVPVDFVLDRLDFDCTGHGGSSSLLN